MNAANRKVLKLRVQSHPAILLLRKRLLDATIKLPALSEKYDDKAETLVRRFRGMKMPTRVVQLQRAHVGVRPCVGGVVFTAVVLALPGGAENDKVVAPLSRLADAFVYHFRASRMRGQTNYNFDIEQAKADCVVLHPLLEEFAKLLIECGVPVMGNAVSEIQWGTTKCSPNMSDNPLVSERECCDVILQRLDMHVTRYEKLEERCKQLEMRCLALEYSVREVVHPGLVQCARGPIGVAPAPTPESPKVWCAAKL